MPNAPPGFTQHAGRQSGDASPALSSRSGALASKVLGTAAILGAAALLAVPAVRTIARRWRTRHPLAAQEHAIDESLDETFPASDPPASRYVDIPVNRR